MITLKASELFIFKKLNINIFYLYSDKQTIILEKNKEIYELKFKIVLSNNEFIIINNYQNVLENFKQVNNELIFPITKNKIEEILTPYIVQNKILLEYVNLIINYRLNRFNLIPYIEVKTYIPKKDIYVDITKLFENVGDNDTFIAYETNATEISNVMTNLEGFKLMVKKFYMNIWKI